MCRLLPKGRKKFFVFFSFVSRFFITFVANNDINMAAINDLIAKIEDEDLRNKIDAELKRLLKQKKFGLVFEDHMPEGLAEGAIYPSLEFVDQVQHAPDKALWHALIEADNYYALQLLAYLYPGMVDCIYIDPPYNTGARDWKYNNDYVDSADQYRHSKWLSMMKRRLLLAKKLLNPRDSVLIVTIDEKEYLHLGCLLEELFPEARMQMATSVINPKGSSRKDLFARCEEYIFYLFFGQAQVIRNDNDMLHPVEKRTVRWAGLLRSGDIGKRSARPNLFYPFFFSKIDGRLFSIGEPLPLEMSKEDVKIPDNCFAVFPTNANGNDARWGVNSTTARDLHKKGYLKFGKWSKGSNFRSISYLQDGTIAAMERGEIEMLGRDNEGSLILGENKKPLIPMTVWNQTSHSAGDFGSSLLNKIFPNIRFSFPKSLYAVHDTIRFFVANKPNALIIDFFAGSGTTLHAVNLLNAEDGGNRRCILVTNNEVSEQEAKDLKKKGFKPGDDEWERLGIARYVTWPRTVCSIEGHDVNGQPLKGEYLGTDHRQMKDGFEANCMFFKLNFLDKTKVALGRQFRELLPLLWMKAGGEGPCPQLETDEIPKKLILPENRLAVLTDETIFTDFMEAVNEYRKIRMVFLVVDSDSLYRDMARCFPQKQTCQLYRDYLDNFRINQTR